MMNEKRNNLVGGLILVGLGVLFLIGRFFDFEGIATPILFMGTIGAIFAIAGIATRDGGFFVPAGIFAGIGLGIGLMDLPLATQVENAEGGLFLLGFAAGWASIVGLTAVFGKRTQWWPLIPGGIMALIGSSLILGEAGLTLLTNIGVYWPVILIIIGIYTIVEQLFQNGKMKQ